MNVDFSGRVDLTTKITSNVTIFLHMRGGLVDGSIKDLEDFEILVGSKIGTWVGTNLQMCV